MFNIIADKICASRLARTTLYSAASTSVRLLFSILSNKIMAFYLGPAGIGLLGQLASFQTIASSIASLGMSSVVVRFIAGPEPEREKSSYLFAAIVITLIMSGSTAGFVALFASNLSMILFGSNSVQGVVILCAVSLLASPLAALILAALNATWQIGLVTIFGILSSVLSVVLLSLGVFAAGWKGALYASASCQLIIGLATLALFPALRRACNPKATEQTREHVRKLLSYTTMAVVSSIAAPVTVFLIRTMLIDRLSLDAAGKWQALWRISETYLSLVISVMSVYYIPRLSELRDDPDNLRNEIFRGFRLFVPAACFMAIVIYMLRNWIVAILFTEEFTEITALFAAQLSGDVLKVASWLLANLMLIRGMIFIYVTLEIMFSVLFYVLSNVMVSYLGLAGMGYSFAMVYAVYFAIVIILFRDVILFRPGPVGPPCT